jgi:ferric-dicitrate binding protein FerR (iron transport regulator)
LVPTLIAACIFIGLFILFAIYSASPTPSGTDRGERRRQAREIGDQKAGPSGPEEKRQVAEGRLHEIDRQKEKLQRPEFPLKSGPQPAERRDKELEKLEREKAQIDREVKEPLVPGPREPRNPAPEPSKATTPPHSERPQIAKEEMKTLTVVATVEEVSGQASLLLKEGKTAASPGKSLTVASGLETSGKASRAVLRFPDKTRLELGPNTVLRDVRIEGGKQIYVETGTVRAEVSKQPENEAMILATPHGVAKVVGTTLRLSVDPDPRKGTRLEVEEGRVELKNLSGAHVEVGSGQFAVAHEGMELVARMVPIDEILLSPRQAVLVGNEWIVAKDRGAAGGTALYSRETSYKIRKVGTGHVYDGVKNRASYVSFNFQAEGGKDYHLWIHGRSLPEDPNHQVTSELAVEPANAQLSQVDGQAALAGDNAYSYTGFFHFQGYGWIGGRGEFGKADAVPLSVRFTQSGAQTLKLYVLQVPAWIDAVWLSATQKTRPEAGQTGPARK